MRTCVSRSSGAAAEDPSERVDRLREMVKAFVRLARADVDGESLVGQPANGFGVEGEPAGRRPAQALGQGSRLLGLRRELFIMMELIIQPADGDEITGEVELGGIDRAGPFSQGAADGQGLPADLERLRLVADLVGQAAELVVSPPQGHLRRPGRSGPGAGTRACRRTPRPRREGVSGGPRIAAP